MRISGDSVRVIGSGRVVNGFDLGKILAIGADFCNLLAMMFAGVRMHSGSSVTQTNVRLVLPQQIQNSCEV